jgi:hypothetical protein
MLQTLFRSPGHNARCDCTLNRIGITKQEIDRSIDVLLEKKTTERLLRSYRKAIRLLAINLISLSCYERLIANLSVTRAYRTRAARPARVTTQAGKVII